MEGRAGEFYRSAGQFEKAAQEFSASTSLEEYPPGYRQRAVTYMRLGQWRSAYADLIKAHQLNPFSSLTLSYLARVEHRLNIPTWSEHMKEAFKAKAATPIAYVNRAAVELELGQSESALKDANKAIGTDAFLKERYEIRSRIRIRMNDAAGANQDAEKAAKLVSHLDL